MPSATHKRRRAGGGWQPSARAMVTMRIAVCRPNGLRLDRTPRLSGMGFPGWGLVKKGAKGVAKGAVGGAKLGVKAGTTLTKWQYSQVKLGGKLALERTLGMKPGSIDKAIATANKTGEPPQLPPQAMMAVQQVPKTWWDKLLEALGLGN